MIDPRDFRSALGAFVTGVTIVTTRDRDGTPVGLTANSFNSVSLDPPMVLWSLGLDSTNLEAFRKAEWWAVHVLASDQEALSGRFARRGTDKFEGLETSQGEHGIPLIGGCAAHFVCRTAFEYEGGDHAIFVGEVVDYARAARTPLAFHQGRYARLLGGGHEEAEAVHRLAVELIAVAETRPDRLEGRLSAEEFATLRTLLGRLMAPDA